MEHLHPERIAPHQQAVLWSSTLGSDWRAGAAVLKQGQGSCVYHTKLNDQEVVIKTMVLKSIKHRVQSMLGATRGARHWLGAKWLSEHDIPTARPIALFHAMENNKLIEVLVLEYLAGRTLLKLMSDMEGARGGQVRVAQLVGGQIAELVRLGRYNRDHKPSNLIVLDEGAESERIAVIDCVALRKVGDKVAQAGHMLASLYIEPTGCGVVLPIGLQLRAVRACARAFEPERVKARQLARELFQVAQSRVLSHGDPTPETDPLAVDASDSESV